ncbi:MAG: hypothetical protein CSB55_00665 [Candidatus Cloacimonadota bacterium]|nr:MAG: hypothetical protein CSB55_00665 [Candidatus Cloacimonadota bacterium]
MKILIIQLAKFGDLIQTGFFIKRLEEFYGASEVFLLGNEIFKDTAYFLPLKEFIDFNVAEAVDFRKSVVTLKSNNYANNLISRLKNEKFDLIINLNSGLLSEQIAKKVSNDFIGFGSHDFASLQWLYFIMSFVKSRQFAGWNLVDIFAGILPEAGEIKPKEGIDNFNIKPGNKVIIHPGAGNIKRSIRPELIAEIADKLTERDLNVIFTGTMPEMEQSKKISDMMKNKGRALNLTGKTSVSDLKNLLVEADLLISGDTGTMHMGAWTGTQTLSVFLGSAFPWETLGYNLNQMTIFPENSNCSLYPCREDSVCRFNYKCRQIISADYVAENLFSSSPDFTALKKDEFGLTAKHIAENDNNILMNLFREFSKIYFGKFDFNEEKINYLKNLLSEKTKTELKRELKIIKFADPENVNPEKLAVSCPRFIFLFYLKKFSAVLGSPVYDKCIEYISAISD